MQPFRLGKRLNWLSCLSMSLIAGHSYLKAGAWSSSFMWFIDRIPRRQTRSDAGIWERGLAFFTGPVFRFASAITTAVVILGLGLRLLFPTSGQPVIESFQGPAPLL